VRREGGIGWRVDAVRDVRAEVAKRLVEHGAELKRLSLGRSRLGDVYTRYFEEMAHAA
jgi:ABC-2 type transport system ATP-binding protein